MKTAVHASLALLVGVAAGCTNARPANHPDASRLATPELAVAAPADSSQPDTGPLTDDQILQVAHAANLGEIEQGKLAQAKAQDPRVKRLARMMVNDHTAADEKGMALAKRAKLNMARSAASTSLESDARAATSTLERLSGDDFDRTYVDTQVKEHRAVLDAIDQKLVPAAKNQELEAYLAEIRPALASHLQQAQDLQKALQK